VRRPRTTCPACNGEHHAPATAPLSTTSATAPGTPANFCAYDTEHGIEFDKKLLGHADVRVTQQAYADLLDETVPRRTLGVVGRAA
jgi:integrase